MTEPAICRTGDIASAAVHGCLSLQKQRASLAGRAEAGHPQRYPACRGWQNGPVSPLQRPTPGVQVGWAGGKAGDMGALRGAVLRWRGRGHHLRVRSGGGCLLGVCAVMVVLAAGFAHLSERGSLVAKAGTPKSPDLLLACRQEPARMARSARFQGPAPHPLVLFVHQDQSPPDAKKQFAFSGSRWQASAYGPVESDQVQLVACAERGYEERLSQTCRYDEGTAPLFSVIYRVRLVEARTGRRVATMTARPSVIECPARPIVDVTRPRAYTPLRPEDFTRVLDPYTTRWAP